MCSLLSEIVSLFYSYSQNLTQTLGILKANIIFYIYTNLEKWMDI